MTGNIKGITIEFKGEDKGLKSVMNHLRNEARAFDKELRQIDNSLKFNPNNPTLLAQKLKVLKDAADDSAKRVTALKDAQKQLDGKEVDKNSQEYRELQREILKAENQQEKYNKEIKKLEASLSPLGQASQKMAELGNKATQAGEALRGLSMAAAGIDVALAGLAYKSGQAADDLNTLSSVTGISTAELQKYKAAADLLDVSVETIAKTQTKMKRSMLSAQQGSTAMAEAFKSLGVSIEDSNGNLRSQDEVFAEAIASLGKMSNETERDALAMQIFGKSASELNPLIEDNGETFQRVADIFKNNNLEIVDQETIDKANAFNDSLDEIKLTWTAALSSIGMQLAGYLAPVIEKVAGWLESIAGWLSTLDPQVLAIIGVIAGVVAGLAPVLIILGKLAFAVSSIMTLMTTIGPAIGGVLAAAAPIVGVVAAIIAIGVLLYKNWDTIKEYAGIVKDWVVQKWTALKDGVVNTVNNLKQKVTETWNNIKTVTTNAFNSVKNTVTTIWNGIKNAITNPIQAAVNFVKSAIDRIRSFFSGLKLQLPHIKLPHFSLTGKLSLMPPSVPHLSIDWYKNGGIFDSPTVFGGVGVGEAGAEAVLPLKKLWEEMDKRFAPSTDNIVINVYPTPSMDVNELADKIQNRLVALQRQKAKAF